MKIITKYCWVGVSSFILGGIIFYFNPFNFISGLLIGTGVTIITLNLSGKLKR
ncbi:MAG: hypothetical protein KKB88_00320 [Nanoarchaeota archaeon]|nr:hypothetical protein [Nanoarchaeota archaeon]